MNTLIDSPNKRTTVLWLLGPTSAGKTTIAVHLAIELRKLGIPIIHYDGDEVRDFFGKGLGFSGANRLRVIHTLVHLANKSAEAGLNVIVSALTAHQDARLYIKENIPHLITGFVKCDIEVCMERDPKGLYQKAKDGQIDTLIGYNTKYVAPDNPDVILETNYTSIGECANNLTEYFNRRGL